MRTMRMSAAPTFGPKRMLGLAALLAGVVTFPVPAQAQVPVFGDPSVLNAGADKDKGKDEAARLASDGHGVWVAVWQVTGFLPSDSSIPDPDSLGHDADILFARSPDNGATWSAPAPVSSLAKLDRGEDRSPALATDGKGTWIAVWSSTEDLSGRGRRDRDIQIAVSKDDAVTWSPPRNLNSNAAADWGDDESPDIATDSAGRWVVVWQSTDSLGNTIGGDKDVLVSTSSDAGLTWTAPAAIDKNAVRDQRSDEVPRLATDSHGRWIVAWSSGGSAADGLRYDRNIVAARSADNAVTWQDPVPVVGGGEQQGRDWGPRLVSDGQGHWLCAWSSTDSLGGRVGMDRDVLAARSSDDGATWSAAYPLNQEADRDAGDDGSPELATDGQGSWVAVWTSWDNRGGTIGADGDLLVALSRDYGATWTDSQILNSNAGNDYGEDLNPTVASDHKGLWLVVWDANEPAGGAIGLDRDLLLVSGRFGGEIAGPPPPPPGL